MRGKKDLNFPAFDAAAADLRNRGWIVFNPAERDREAGLGPDQLIRDTSYYMAIDLPEVCKADCIITLPEWENSEGCGIEFAVATRLRKPVYSYTTGARLFPNAIDKTSLMPSYIETNHTEPTPVPPESPEDEGTNPKDLLGLKKAPLRLVPSSLILRVARVMALGAKKYGPFNWREKKIRLTVYTEAAMRHLLAFQDGEEFDPESGESHAAHVAACMGILLDAEACNCLVDDRHQGPAADLLLEIQDRVAGEMAAEESLTDNPS
jgi:hypothetical protein